MRLDHIEGIRSSLFACQYRAIGRAGVRKLTALHCHQGSRLQGLNIVWMPAGQRLERGVGAWTAATSQLDLQHQGKRAWIVRSTLQRLLRVVLRTFDVAGHQLQLADADLYGRVEIRQPGSTLQHAARVAKIAGCDKAARERHLHREIVRDFRSQFLGCRHRIVALQLADIKIHQRNPRSHVATLRLTGLLEMADRVVDSSGPLLKDAKFVQGIRVICALGKQFAKTPTSVFELSFSHIHARKIECRRLEGRIFRENRGIRGPRARAITGRLLDRRHETGQCQILR